MEKRAIPAALRGKGPGTTIRAWVPGCGAGQAAYTLAMLLLEQAEAAGGAVEVRVFATEADAADLSFGREGLYPAGIAAELPRERLRRYFVREAGGYRVGAELRRMMFFAAHDPIGDAPYLQLDLIYCAHLRAPADEEARHRLAGNLRRGLRTGGLLAQGTSPLIAAPDDWFEAVSDETTILRRTAWPHLEDSEGGFAAIGMDHQLRVRWITPLISRLFGLDASDVGGPIEGLAPRLHDPDLPDDARALLSGREPAARQVGGCRGRRFIRRLQLVRSPGAAPRGVLAVFIDVSSLKAAEGEARAARADLRSIVDAVREPLIVLDADSRAGSANGSYYKAFRVDPGETEGRWIHDLGRGLADEPRLEAGLLRALSGGAALDDVEIEAEVPHLGRRTMLVGARRVKGIPLVLLSIEDVTERRRIAAALEESQRRLQTLFENAQDAIFLADDLGRFVDVNPVACSLTGYDRAELLERTVADLTPEPDGPDDFDCWESFLRRGRLEGERRLIRKDGRSITVDLRAVAGILPGLHMAIARDITERKRLEMEVLEIASAEQRRIGQELHDDAGQVLTGLGLMARVLVERLEDSPAEQRIADRIVGGIGEVLDRIRAVARGLIPVEVDADGLMAALADLAFRTDELEGITCRFECAEPVTVRDNTTATELYRIAQEAVTNAVRHGRPTNIRIALERVDGRIHLEVADDGRGLPDTPGEQAGRGMRIMRHRAGLIGASLSVGRKEGAGTLVRCIFNEEDRHG